MLKKLKTLHLKNRIMIIFVFCFILLSLVVALSASPSTEKLVYGKNSSELTLQDKGDGYFAYVNIEGEITYAADKHYAAYQRMMDDENRILQEMYYDDFYRPCALSNGAYGYKKEYNDNQIVQIWLDAKNEPKKVSSGYAISVTTVTSEKSEVRYYDSKMHPVCCTSDFWGYDDILNDSGKVISRIYVGKDGQAVKTKYGYAGFTRTYDAQNRVHTEKYFDIEQSTAILSEGQSGVTYTYDEKNRISETFFLNAEGEKMTGSNQYAATCKVYDDAGRTASLIYLDIESHPVLCKNGYAIENRTYYADNSTKTVRYYDAEGKPVKNQEGCYGRLYLDEVVLSLNADGSIAVSINKVLRVYPVAVPLIALFLTVVTAFTYQARSQLQNEEKLVNLWTVLKSKWFKWLLFLVAFFIIIYETLHNRTPGEHRANLTLFWSYATFFSSAAMRLQILNNIWLFVPLGSWMILTACPKKNLVFIPLTTIAVESIQFLTATGLAELDDIFHNSLGGLMGFLMVVSFISIIRHSSERQTKISS